MAPCSAEAKPVESSPVCFDRHRSSPHAALDSSGVRRDHLSRRLSLLIVRSSAFVDSSASQAPRQAAAASITPEQVAPFVGDWAVTVGMNTFEATFAVAVKTDGGKVTATVSADGQPTVNVTDISMAATVWCSSTSTAWRHADLDGPDADA